MFKTWSRRGVLVVGALLAMPTWAQSVDAGKLSRVGVFSFLGDSVQANWTDDKPRQTRIERNEAQNLEFKGIGFDLIALRVSGAAFKRANPQVQVLSYKAPEELTPAQQRAVSEGAAKAELPAWLVATINKDKLGHLLIVTRHRGAVLAETGDNVAIGRGSVEGIGFYLDTLYTMRNTATGAVSTGLIAPYANIRFQLMDVATGDIVAQYDVRESYAYASPDTQVAADPWTFMAPAEKVRALRELVEVGTGRAVLALLGRKS